MCAKVDGARTVQRCAERLETACARFGAVPVAAEVPDWARALLARLERVPGTRRGG
jgi:hypothetical protein